MFIEVPLRIHQGNSWVGELRDERLLHCTTFVMVVEVEGDLVVASATRSPRSPRSPRGGGSPRSCACKALGVPIRATFRPPPEIPIQPNQVYFLIDTAIHCGRSWSPSARSRSSCAPLRPAARPRAPVGDPPQGALTMQATRWMRERVADASRTSSCSSAPCEAGGVDPTRSARRIEGAVVRVKWDDDRARRSASPPSHCSRVRLALIATADEITQRRGSRCDYSAPPPPNEPPLLQQKHFNGTWIAGHTFFEELS
jgi:hypothetical protein